MARWMIVRDIGIWVAGLLALAHEVLVTSGERPYLLILIAGLLGLPVFLHKDGHAGSGTPTTPAELPGPPAVPPPGRHPQEPVA